MVKEFELKCLAFIPICEVMKDILSHKANRLFVILGGVFIANALIAEFIGVKIFSLEKTLGLPIADISLFGIDNLSFNLTAGVLLWPVVFVMTDVINEYYGKRGVRMLSFLAVGLIAYAFVVFYFGIRLTPAGFWPGSHIEAISDPQQQRLMRLEVGNYNTAFALVFGQGLWIIIGSLVAFLIGQFIDVIVFQGIKKYTGEKKVWLRATGSTLVSQCLDSFVVLFIAFYIGAGWSFELVLAIGLVNYAYKFTMAIILTPAIYLAHFAIDKYLGADLARAMKRDAADFS